MKVILLKKVADLGQRGEIKDVSDGFALNFLFPQKLAEVATPKAMRASSRAWVQDVVSKTLEAPSIASRRASTFCPKGPFPATRPARACAIRLGSESSNHGSVSWMVRSPTDGPGPPGSLMAGVMLSPPLRGPGVRRPSPGTRARVLTGLQHRARISRLSIRKG